MFRIHSALKIVAAMVLVAMLAVSSFADTIKLKDGSIIKGTIVEFSEGRFVVVIGEGTSRRRELSFSAIEVESVRFESQATAVRKTASVPVQTNVSTNAPPVRPVVRETSATVDTRPTTTTDKAPTLPSSRPAAGAKPIEVSVKVLADNTNNGWTNSGWVVRKGQRIRVTGAGEISLGGSLKTTSGGIYDHEDDGKLLKAVPTGALIAVIGDDNNDFIYIGESREFVAERDGALFFGVNEGNLNDNTGSFSVKVEIDPASDR